MCENVQVRWEDLQLRLHIHLDATFTFFYSASIQLYILNRYDL